MKTVLIFTVALAFLLPSCTETCNCSKMCLSYDHGQVIFYPSMQDTAYTNHETDSLTNLYGTGKDSSVHVSTTHNSALETQLESQGYFCTCPK